MIPYRGGATLSRHSPWAAAQHGANGHQAGRQQRVTYGGQAVNATQPAPASLSRYGTTQLLQRSTVLPLHHAINGGPSLLTGSRQISQQRDFNGWPSLLTGVSVYSTVTINGGRHFSREAVSIHSSVTSTGCRHCGGAFRQLRMTARQCNILLPHTLRCLALLSCTTPFLLHTVHNSSRIPIPHREGRGGSDKVSSTG